MSASKRSKRIHLDSRHVLQHPTMWQEVSRYSAALHSSFDHVVAVWGHAIYRQAAFIGDVQLRGLVKGPLHDVSTKFFILRSQLLPSRLVLISAQNSALNNENYKEANGMTHCNEALSAITLEVGGPMDVIKGNATNIIDNIINAKKSLNLDKFRQASSWRDAQTAANAGVLAIAVWRNPDGGHSHVASVRPEDVPGDNPRPGSGALLANIGPEEYSGIVHQSKAFNRHKVVTYWILKRN